MKIYLYSTAGCHLCEQAKVVLWPVLLQYQCRLIDIDIASTDALIEQYGTRIPVLAAAIHSDGNYPDGNHRELDWPFTAQDVDVFFAELAGL